MWWRTTRNLNPRDRNGQEALNTKDEWTNSQHGHPGVLRSAKHPELVSWTTSFWREVKVL